MISRPIVVSKIIKIEKRPPSNNLRIRWTYNLFASGIRRSTFSYFQGHIFRRITIDWTCHHHVERCSEWTSFLDCAHSGSLFRVTCGVSVSISNVWNKIRFYLRFWISFENLCNVLIYTRSVVVSRNSYEIYQYQNGKRHRLFFYQFQPLFRDCDVVKMARDDVMFSLSEVSVIRFSNIRVIRL